MVAKVERGLVKQFVVVVATPVLIAAATQYSLRRQIDDHRWMAHTYAVIGQAETTLSLVKDAETGQRGYLLVGRDEYLAPYLAAAAALPREVDRLAGLVRGGPSQSANVAALRKLVDEKLAELRQTVGLYRKAGAGASLAVVMTDRGQRLMDQIREVARVIEGEEHARLARRTPQAELTQQAVSILSWCGALVGLVTMAFAYRRVAGEFARRREAEERLRESQQTLKDNIRAARDLNFALERANAQLAEQALCDELTGLKNRRSFDDDLGRYLALARRNGAAMSVALVGVDGLEAFNEAHGRSAGDDLLRSVATALLGVVRGGDVVGRYGGGFLVALPGADRWTSRDAGERLRAAVAGRDWPLEPVTVSVGLASLGDGATDPDALIDRADQALLHSRRQGGDRLTHSDDLAPATSAPGATRIPAVAPAC